jgi:hypothetical protein
MTENELSLPQKPDKTSIYRIVIDGELHESWSDWLGKVELERKQQGVDICHTILLSEVPDQAALRGLLNRIWDLNLKLISLNKCKQDKQGTTDEY